MKKLLKKFLSNPWATALIAPLILAIITPIWLSWWNKINLNQAFCLIGSFLKNAIITFFNYKLPIWIILLIILAIIALKSILNLIENYLGNISKSPRRSHPDWYYDFRKMKFKEWFFVWNYQIYSNDKIEIIDLKPICDCKCDLLSKSKIGNMHYGRSVLQCPNCKKIYTKPTESDIEELKCIIIHKININQFVN